MRFLLLRSSLPDPFGGSTARRAPYLLAGLTLVLPVELVKPAESWADEVVQSEAKRRWYRDHGIDPGD